MKQFVPDYYSKFHCIAGKCRHSCCIGWEIDLDKDTLCKYAGVSGSLGEELKRHIAVRDDGTAHFILSGKEERCPFLRKDGLCRLFIELGEESLSQICTDHPRFRNFYTDRTETGLGMCCEAAAALILSWEEPFHLLRIDENVETLSCTKEETLFFQWRSNLITAVCDRSVPLLHRLDFLLDPLVYEMLEPKRWLDTFLGLEILDPEWGILLEKMKNTPMPVLLPELSVPMEQLLCYFLFRHLSGGMEDGRYIQRLAFCVLCFFMVVLSAAAINDTMSLETLTEAARRFSTEIEYSDENVAALLFALEEQMDDCFHDD